MSERILVADDEKSIRDTLSIVLADEGFAVDTAQNGKEALELLNDRNYGLLICDLKMPEVDGMTVIEESLKRYPETMAIVITAYGTMDSAINALRAGAHDYVLKPLDLDSFILKIKRLFEYKEMALENQSLRQELQRQYNFENIIGESPAMKRVFGLIKKVANNKSIVLITGQSGTGKELVARAIHYNNPLTKGRFIPINCGAIHETLIESELFGHKKGAFTGAISDKEGFFKAAHQGTLFLDEIAELPIHLQVKLLRALENKEIYPVGGTQPIPIDVRIIAATNRSLKDMVANGTFREDLYYRINVVQIDLPPLEERREDIPILVNHFIHKYNQELNKNIKNVTNDTMRILINTQWKGGIRELENVIERALILSEQDYITVDVLPPNLTQDYKSETSTDNLREAVRLFEAQHIARVIRNTGNSKQQAAQLLGLSLSSLYRKIDELSIQTDAEGADE